MRILAFDLGTFTGWASRQRVDGVWGWIDHDRINLTPSRWEGGGMRYVKFCRTLMELSDAFPFDLVVFEEVRRHLGVDAAHVYGGLLAQLTKYCELRKIPYQGVPVGTIKKSATGLGNASKEAMVEAAKAYIVRAGQPVPDLSHDEADAICLLLWAQTNLGGNDAANLPEPSAPR